MRTIALILQGGVALYRVVATFLFFNDSLVLRRSFSSKVSFESHWELIVLQHLLGAYLFYGTLKAMCILVEDTATNLIWARLFPKVVAVGSLCASLFLLYLVWHTDAYENMTRNFVALLCAYQIILLLLASLQRIVLAAVVAHTTK